MNLCFATTFCNDFEPVCQCVNIGEHCVYKIQIVPSLNLKFYRLPSCLNPIDYNTIIKFAERNKTAQRNEISNHLAKESKPFKMGKSSSKLKKPRRSQSM